jgi:predicted DNA-binding protein YlxM (UPF0122 family)
MDKDLDLIELFELYQGLLTDKQRELFSSYYVFDLSLSEIAEPLGTTRQSVYEGVKKVRKKLIEYENLLKLKEKNLELKSVAQKLSETNGELAAKILEIIGR